MHGIADPDSFVPSKHYAVIDAFQCLLIDLRLQLRGGVPAEAGWQPEPITPERLDRLRDLLHTLDDCRDPGYQIRY
jgi:hypothetical protein